MFSHQQSHLRQVVHLSAFLKLPSDALQRLLAVSAELGTMTHHLISAGYLHQGAPSMSWLPSGPLLAPLAVAPRLSSWAATRRRFATVVAIFRQLPF